MKKFIGTVSATLFIMVLSILYVLPIFLTDVPTVFKIILLVGLSLFLLGLIYVLIERIKEIRKEEKDDYSKY